MKQSLHNLRMKLYWAKIFRAQWYRQRDSLVFLILFKVLLLGLGLASPLLFKLLIDQVIVNRELNALWMVCTGYVVIYIAETVISGGQISIGNKFSNLLGFAVRKAVWDKYLRMPLRTYDQMNIGDLKARVDQDADSVDRLFKVQLLDYGYSYAFLIIGAVMMMIFSWKLALFGLLMVPVSFWITRRLSTGAQRVSTDYRRIYGQYEGWLQHSIQGWREIKTSRMEKRVSLKFTEYWHDISKVFFQKEMYWFTGRILQEFKDLFITRMNLYFIGGLFILHGEMTIGSLLVFMKYYEMMFTQLGAINELDMQFTGDLPGLEKIKEMIGDANDQPADVNVPLAAILSGDCALSVDDISFVYGDGGKPVLQQISFEIQAGERIAIVGRSGSGKSTLVKLLLGAYPPHTGKIRLAGQELHRIDESLLRRTIGAVMQDPAIFNMSIMDNVKLARPKAAAADIEAACRLAHMDEFIVKLPLQYDTVIGEKGVQLSGGQKQRLALARVLLSNASIIILDEATSMLDHELETAIHQAFEQLPDDRTIITVAHRLSSVLRADRIMLVDEGTIVAEGSHHELWLENALYRKLFDHNLNGSLPQA